MRHHFVMMNGIDPRHAFEENRLQASSENIKTEDDYTKETARPAMERQGSATVRLEETYTLVPQNIAAFSKTPMASDGYIHLTIAEGGALVWSAMPPFKGRLKEDEVWKIYLPARALTGTGTKTNAEGG